MENGRVFLRPIAGTRPRGRTEEEDADLERELRADEKERAEHLMLVDLGRNDVGKVARYGSVVVPAAMLVLTVLRGEETLPIEITRGQVLVPSVEVETLEEGFGYARIFQVSRSTPGAVGYLSYDRKTMDTAIGIRTILAEAGRAHVQAGAGIVADSVPDREYEETLGKAQALLKALAIARER